jgi:hypothetical protein
MTLADRWRGGCPFQNCIRTDKLLGPTFSESSETTEHVCLHLVLESHASVKLNMSLNSAFHIPLSFGHGWAICSSAAKSTFA